MKVYLDHSATTKPCEQAIAEMVLAMREGYHNPSALYAPAMQAEKKLMQARAVLANSVGVAAKDVVFTSGGTESNNLAIIGHMIGQRKEGLILFSAAEHPAVKNACLEAAALHGQVAKEIPLTQSGTLDMMALESMLDSRVRLICVMQVCNETGVIMPLSKVVKLRDRLAPKAAIHVDGVQGYLRIPFSLMEMGVQSYAVSAHKVNGPKGVGALLIRGDHRIRPLLVGGGQEGNLRSGTENTAGIAGFRAAVVSYPHYAFVEPHTRALKEAMVSRLRSEIPDLVMIGSPPKATDSAGHILAIAFPPVRAETLLHALEEDGILIGTGSACSSKKAKRSAVLTAMKVPPEVMDSAVRISFSVNNTREEIAYASEKIIEKVSLLRRFKRR